MSASQIGQMSARWRYLEKWVAGRDEGCCLEPLRELKSREDIWKQGWAFERMFEDIWGGTLKKKMNTSSREALFGNHFWQVKLFVSHAGQISASRKLDRYLVHAGAYSFNCSWIHENIGSIGVSYWIFWIFNIPSKILVLFFLFEKYIYLLSLNRFLS